MADFLKLVVFSIFDHVKQILGIFNVDIRNLRTRFTLYTEFRDVLRKLKIRSNFSLSQIFEIFEIFQKWVASPETRY